MTRPVSLSILLLAVVVVAAGSPWHALPALADSPTAVLTSCKGPVTVTRAGGSAVEATFGLALGEGDEVKTGKDAEAEIMFAAGNWVTVGPNSSMRIKGHREAAAPEKSESFEVVQNSSA